MILVSLTCCFRRRITRRPALVVYFRLSKSNTIAEAGFSARIFCMSFSSFGALDESIFPSNAIVSTSSVLDSVTVISVFIIHSFPERCLFHCLFGSNCTSIIMGSQCLRLNYASQRCFASAGFCGTNRFFKTATERSMFSAVICS